MKQLVLGAVLVFVLGLAGFLYRYTLERPNVSPAATACTTEARVCPDGTSVGRSGPSCNFSACPLPNVDMTQLGIAFALPAGYAANLNALTEGDDLVAAYEKTSLTKEVPHAIVIRRYQIPAGKTANDVLLAETAYDTSGEPVRNMTEFKPIIINSKTFQMISTDRFEAQVHTVYYLPRATDVLRFEVLERDVVAWTDPSLDIATLPEHRALLQMLGTLQVQ
ncbi:MAG TPA: hypothetical protein VF696_01165 [Candidatus Paceibacterota bacterium]|jgi:hypothetical protein